MKEEKGVTLIALIITIIVMLILVLVTINIVTTGGIVNKTIEAKTQTQAAQLNEQNQMNTVANGIDAAVANTSGSGGFIGNIVQPEILYVPDVNVPVSEIFINPTPVAPDILFPTLGNDSQGQPISGVAAAFTDGDNYFRIFAIDTSSENSPQYILIQDSNEVTGIFVLYIRIWTAGTFNLYDLGPLQYSNGWNKIILNLDENGEPVGLIVEDIQINEIPSFAGNYVLSDEYNNETHIGNFMNIATYWDIVPVN